MANESFRPATEGFAIFAHIIIASKGRACSAIMREILSRIDHRRGRYPGSRC
jgi:hypothetical protein